MHVDSTITERHSASDETVSAGASANDPCDRSPLAENEAMFRLVALSARDAVIVTDGEDKISFWNPAAEHMLGYSEAEALGQKCHELVAPERYRAEFTSGLERFRKSGEGDAVGKTIELGALRKDGSEITVELSLAAMCLNHEWSAVAILRDISDRKRAQVLIEASESMYRGLWDSMNEGCAICRLIRDGNGQTVDYRIIDVNPAFSEVTGMSRESALSSIPSELFQASMSPHLKELDDVDKNQTPSTFETPAPVGGKFYRVSVSPLTQGEVAVLFVDLTDQRQIQDALRKSEERYQELFSAVHEGILVVDEHELIGYCNPASASIFEVRSAEALVGRSLLDFVPAHEQKKVRQQTEMCAQQQSSEYELEIITDKANAKTVLLSVSPRFDSKENFRGAFAALLDITDRKRIEEELRQSQEQLQAILDNVGIGIAVISPQMEVLSLNKQMKSWFPEVDVKNRPVCHRAFNDPPSETICSYCPTFKTFRDGEIHESVTRTPQGNSFTSYRVVASPIKSETGDVIAVIEMVEDMTESHEAETVKRDLERRLQETSKLEAVGSLAAGIAHEINTPIQFVGDNTHYLSDCFDTLLKLITTHQHIWTRAGQGEAYQELDELWHKAEEEADLEYTIDEVPAAISQTLDGVQRVGQIVRSMKEFAHTDRKETSRCDLNRMLDSTLTVARNELKYVADVVTDYDPELPQIDCHRDELNQVFLNMLINAAHAIADIVGDGSNGRGKITVKTRKEADDVLVAISDTGTGIPDAVKDRIFDPFFTTKEIGKGTGQGLYISHAVVVDKHRGSLTLDTEIGKGTTFYVRLPIEQAAGDNGVVQAAAAEADNSNEDMKIGGTE